MTHRGEGEQENHWKEQEGGSWGLKKGSIRASGIGTV